MINKLATSHHEQSSPNFVLVLSRDEVNWIKVARQLEQQRDRLMASYYLIDQLPVLQQARLISGYSLCIVVGVQGINHEEKLHLQQLSDVMPVVMLKQATNLYDFNLENLCYDHITDDAVRFLDLCQYCDQVIRSYRAAREHSMIAAENHCAVVAGEDIAISVDHDAVDVEAFMGEVVDSLRVVSRSRGVKLEWLPQGEDLPVVLARQETKRHIVDLLLELFDVYRDVRIATSPASLMCDHSVWFDLIVSKPRFSEAFRCRESEAYQLLKQALHHQGGSAVILEQHEDALALRLEWRLRQD